MLGPGELLEDMSAGKLVVIAGVCKCKVMCSVAVTTRVIRLGSSSLYNFESNLTHLYVQFTCFPNGN